VNEREVDTEDKTEEATEERRRQYREEGKIANPREIVHAFALIIMTIGLYVSGSQIQTGFHTLFQRSWLNMRPNTINTEDLMIVIYRAVEPLIPLLGVLSVALVIFPLMIGLVFTRFNWTWKKLTFDFANMNPVNGFQRMFSLKTIPELIKNILKIIVLSSVSYFVIKDALFDVRKTHALEVSAMAGSLAQTTIELLFSVAIAGLALGGADWAWNWWQLERQMKMSKQEIKEEMKKEEGDPHFRAARRRRAREIVMAKAVKDVPKATFIVTNPEHFAVAVRYVKGGGAPVVVAKGMDFLALQIREIAKKNDIVIVENKPLARTLYKTVKIGQEVPQSLWTSVVEVMKYIVLARGQDYFDQRTAAANLNATLGDSA
jgi:flagellar biosynthetic protein FlhB